MPLITKPLLSFCAVVTLKLYLPKPGYWMVLFAVFGQPGPVIDQDLVYALWKSWYLHDSLLVPVDQQASSSVSCVKDVVFLFQESSRVIVCDFQTDVQASVSLCAHPYRVSLTPAAFISWGNLTSQVAGPLHLLHQLLSW